MLASLCAWLEQYTSGTGIEINNTSVLANDASKFIKYFGQIIAQSSPHIYISALPFAPASSVVGQKYLPNFQSVMSMKLGKLSHWPAIQGLMIKLFKYGMWKQENQH
ncbi:hypothetical protein OF83DRAFT_1172489 [Amylostereum chailletii]|nr:hypothetical protein OF83DRAFT_1172489 [Amylostereum chailletii]